MRMKKNISLFVLTTLLWACGTKEQEAELISFEELAGETGTEQNQAAPAETDHYEQAPLFREFIQGQVSLFDTSQNIKAHPLDRFGFSSAMKLNFKHKAGAGTPETGPSSASVYYYTFSDSLKTKNAFYNWLDCFGKDCDAVQLNKKMDKLSADPSITLVYDTTIVAIEYGCADARGTWKSLQDSLISTFGKSYKYRLEVKCNGPVEWK